MKNLLVAIPLFLVACHSGSGAGDIPVAPLVVLADMDTVKSSPAGDWITGIDRARLGLRPEETVTCYDLTTPAGEAFQFDVVSRRAGNNGDVMVALAHAADGSSTPSGLDSIAQAGMIPSASGALQQSPWLEAWGDGFSRISIRGAVQQDQILALRGDNGDGKARALVRIAIGPRSAINVIPGNGSNYPGVLDTRTIYSSNSWMFGLPTVTVSGNRTTVVTYEGDRADPTRDQRYEMRLQVDHQTNAVTGGASVEASPDSGNWRDHEIAGLFNTLAIVHCGYRSVDLRLSYDRGASFTQTIELATSTVGIMRLCQVAMAADYSLAVTFWRSYESGASQLLLARGTPVAFDPQGSPTWYEMRPLETVHTVPGDMVPALMDIAWSEGGDLVLGYAFTAFQAVGFIDRTESHCAVIPWQGTLRDTLVDAEEELLIRDPSVAVLGSGSSMRIFFAYEARAGVQLRTSNDAGATFGAAVTVERNTWMPSVLARMQNGAPRVDLLYLVRGATGQELHLSHWDDFDHSTRGDFRLTTATQIASASVPRNQLVPGAGPATSPPMYGVRITEVPWFGYDAVLVGDDVVVVYDESTRDAAICGTPPSGNSNGTSSTWPNMAGFSPATPPPLAPGLTQAVAPPNSSHMHQLKMLRLD